MGRDYFDVGGDEPSPSADMGGVSPGPVPLLRGLSESVPVQMWAGLGPTQVQMRAEARRGIPAEKAHGGECATA